jgi:hypothetical protein
MKRFWRCSVAAVAIAAVAWPQAAEACTLAKLVGSWTLRVIETDVYYPPEGGHGFEQTSHITCTLRITRSGAPAGEALATASDCTMSVYSGAAEFPDELFEIYRTHDQGRCEWLLSSVTEEFSHSGLPPRSVNGTGDGSNRLRLDRRGEFLIGAGNLPIGFAGVASEAPDLYHWIGFQVSLFGVKH